MSHSNLSCRAMLAGVASVPALALVADAFASVAIFPILLTTPGRASRIIFWTSTSIVMNPRRCSRKFCRWPLG